MVGYTILSCLKANSDNNCGYNKTVAIATINKARGKEEELEWRKEVQQTMPAAHWMVSKMELRMRLCSKALI